MMEMHPIKADEKFLELEYYHFDLVSNTNKPGHIIRVTSFLPYSEEYADELRQHIERIENVL